MKSLKLYSKNSINFIGNINLYWLLWTLVIFFVTLLTVNIHQFIVDINLPIGLPVFLFLILILINGIFYKGLKRQINCQKAAKIDQKLSHKNFSCKKYYTVDEVAEQKIEEIINYIDQEKPYTDLGFSLGQLAEQLQMSRRSTSQLINNYFNKNFMTFINDYRIDLAKKRLKNPIDPKETILEIMYEVGFNSKSSFNTLFKKDTGLTPKEYKSKYSFSYHDNSGLVE